MALREDRIGQTWLVPKRVTDFIPENHVCYFITNIVEKVDFQKINQKYRHTKGEPAYSRRMLLRMVLMAFVDGVFSSRRIARLAEENVVYMYLSGNWINQISGQFVASKSNAQRKLKKHLK